MRAPAVFIAALLRSYRTRGARRAATAIASLVIAVAAASTVAAAVAVLWTAGGLDAGTTGAGQAARMDVDAQGNVAIVSGPAINSVDLAVTSYTANGTLRWRRTVTPPIGSFLGDWVAAAPDGDIVAVGHNVTSRGNPIAITIVRYSTDGTLQSRVDLARTSPIVGRLLVDAASNAYLAFSSVGDGQDIQLHKYSPAGVLLWSQVIATGFAANDVAKSLALSPDGADVVLTGNIAGGATWITAAYNALTGARRWLVTGDEGLFASDVVVDATRVYVTGQGATGAGTPALANWLTLVVYDRATGARLRRTDVKPASSGGAAGLRMTVAPDGGLVVAGQANRGFLDWYTVAFDTSGAVKWQAVRDGGLNTDEIPRAVFALPDGTIVVTGRGGPNLPGGFIPGVTVGYGPGGTLIWEAFAGMETVWASALPSGDVCATGGYDALITCWRVSAGGVNAPPTAVMVATPPSGASPLTVSFDGSGSTDADGSIRSWSWSFGDGGFGSGVGTAHMYGLPGTYTASLTVTDNGGATNTTTTSIVVTANVPSAPANLTASTLTRRTIALAWTNGAIGQIGVRIERCAGTGCTSFTEVAAVPGTATSFTDRSLTPGTVYTYRARAYNAAGNSPYSNTATARTR